MRSPLPRVLWWLAVLGGWACSSSREEKRPDTAQATPAPSPQPAAAPAAVGAVVVEHPNGEARRLRNIRQVTFDGRRNAEPYFSPDGRQIVFQSVRGDNPFYQLFVMDPDGRNARMISTGKGQATCAAFAPDRPRILFASSHLDPDAWPAARARDLAAQEEEARKTGQPISSWEVNAAMDLFEVDLDGKNITRLTTNPGYDAEGSYSPDGKRILFTSLREGDLDLYIQDVGKEAATRLTTTPGYDGSGFFSPDGKRVVFRSFRAGDQTSDLYLINADGTGEQRLTDLKGVSWSPFFHPDGKRVIFSSNLRPNTQTPGQNFDLYLLDLETRALERVTYEGGYDGLPSFSPDGKTLAWTSARQGGTNQIFLADWVD
ncbi:MAG: hypothetical protein AB2A00_34470 [Myxococcota bacterium]